MNEKDPNKIIILQMSFPMYFIDVDFLFSIEILSTTEN